MSFDAGSIIAQAEVDQNKFNRDLDAMEARAKRFEDARHEVRFRVSMQDSDLQRARQQFARFDQQLYTDAVQRQRSGRGILAGLFGRVAPGGTTGATLFGGLVGSGGASSSAATETAIRNEMTRLDSTLSRDAIRNTARAATTASGGGGRSGGFISNLLGGIGPAIPGVGLRAAGILGLGAPLIGALPALLGGVAALGLGGVGAGLVGLGAKQLVGNKQNPGVLYSQAQTADTALKSGFASAVTPLTGVLRRVFDQVPSLMKGIAPALRSAFAGAATLVEPIIKGLSDLAKTVLPLLGSAFRVIAPLMRPFLDGLAGLLKGVLTGLLPLLRAVKPAVDVLKSALVLIGRDLGSMFKDFAPVVSASSIILKGLLSVVAALLPIIGKLAAIFAATLAPVFKVFAGVIKDILPVLTIIGKVLGELAGAILGDLSAAFGALASLLKDITPSLNILANILGKVFNVLENSGVFAVLGNGIEAVVKPLAALINAFVRGLAPVLPKIVGLISNLSSQGVRILVTALQILLPILTQITEQTLPVFVTILNSLLPAINAVAKVISTGLVDVLKVLAPILRTIGPYVLAIYAAVKLWAIAQGALDALLSANPIGLIVIAVAALGIGIALLAQHWHTVWTNIKNWALDAWHAIDNEVIHPLMRAFDDVRNFIEIWALRIAIIFAGWAENILHYAQDAFGWLPDFIPGAAGIKAGLASAHNDLANFVSNTQAALAKLTDHSYPLKFSIKLPPGAVTNTPGARSGGAPTRPGMAAGSPRGGAPPGWAWVGEKGPELAYFHGGETVLPNHVSMAVSRGFAAGTGIVTVHLSDPSLAAIRSVLGSIVHSAVSAVQSNYIVQAIGGLIGGGGLGRSNLRGLENLWIGAGGPGGIIAHIAAAIAMAESGGNPLAFNPSGASGLWQILGQLVPGNIFNPAVNALNAVAKFRGAGGFSPWVTYMTGAYLAFMDQGGWLLPGASVTMNQTGMREAVLTPSQSHSYTMLARAAEGLMSGRTGGESRRQLAETVNIMLPEGSTVAQAMNELLLRMQIAEMQGFAGLTT